MSQIVKGILQLAGLSFCKTGFPAINFVTIQALIEPSLSLTKVILCNVTHRYGIRYITQLLLDDPCIKFLVVHPNSVKHSTNAGKLLFRLRLLIILRKTIEPTFMLIDYSLAFFRRSRLIISLEFISHQRVWNQIYNLLHNSSFNSLYLFFALLIPMRISSMMASFSGPSGTFCQTYFAYRLSCSYCSFANSLSVIAFASLD